MCGRYSLTKKEWRIVSQFSEEELELFLRQRFNIAPTQPVPIIYIFDGKLVQREMRWGLQPAWSKAPIINAQCETILEKPTFRDAFLHRRCLIPADGFYEWRRKTPIRFVMRDRSPFCFAGIWDTWHKAADEKPECCCILTTAPNELVAPCHNRMPLILPSTAYDTWLNPASTLETLQSLLRTPAAQLMEGYEVDPLVNKATNDDPRCAEPPAEFRLE
jgi:putative SOS response-associated peptidase YedK